MRPSQERGTPTAPLSRGRNRLRFPQVTGTIGVIGPSPGKTQ